jgi:tRNA nucleotidyltransferase (CCA-adding enzyme)
MVKILVTNKMNTNRWEHFPHQADVGIRGVGATRERAFEQAAVALTAVITDPEKVEPRERVEIECRAPDDELLLIDWLSKLLYEMDTRKMLFGKFEVHIEEGRLQGSAWGQNTDVSKHQPAAEVKGATYTALSVGRQEDGTWTAQCVVDV